MSDDELVRDGFKTVKEAAHHLAIGQTKLRELIREGELVAIRVGKVTNVSVRSINIYAASILERRDRVAAA